jgi:hypothetical protein
MSSLKWLLEVIQAGQADHEPRRIHRFIQLHTELLPVRPSHLPVEDAAADRQNYALSG